MSDLSPSEENSVVPGVRRLHGSRRAVRPGAQGTDPTPQAAEAVRAVEDTDAHADADSNDAQLKQDVPPHWG